MLTVTDTAAQYLCDALSRKGEGLPEAIRLVYAEEGYQLILDDAKDGDQVFEQDGQSYLIMDAEVGEALTDATIDVQESPQGARITLLATGTPQPRPPSEPEPEVEPKP